LKRNLATEGLQPIPAGLFEFICYENSHALLSCQSWKNLVNPV
jgi:hypothetical protein